MNLFDRYLRWRHSHGFGVHSPFGFRIVERVLCHDRHARYGDAAIVSALGGYRNRDLERKARMLLRLVAELRPGKVFIPADSHAAYIAAILAADSRTRLIRNPRQIGEASLLCSARDLISLQAITDHLSQQGCAAALIDLPETWIERIIESLPQGIAFAGLHNLLVINRPMTAKVAYSVKL